MDEYQEYLQERYKEEYINDLAEKQYEEKAAQEWEDMWVYISRSDTAYWPSK